MLDPYRSQMKANSLRAQDKAGRIERRLREREMLRDAPAPQSVITRLRGVWMALRRSR